MEIRHTLQKLNVHTSLALGVFDGVHIGHQAVIGEAACGGEDGLLSAVFTFDMKQMRPSRKEGQALILTDSLKQQKIAEMGISLLLDVPFETVRELSPKAFVRDVLYGRLSAKKVVCGYDFRFGKNAAGTPETLASLGKELGIEVLTVPPMMENGKAVSSTRIRYALMAGEIETANRLLGYPYTYDMPVTEGLKNGRKMGVPTINQEFAPGQLIPKFGVYASHVLLDGKTYLGMTNIGVKPTIDGVRSPLAETYIVGIDRDLYGRKVPVSLFAYLREEKKFSGLEELSAVVKGDIETIRSKYGKTLLTR